MERFPYLLLVPVALLLAVAPFGAEPHLLEKLGMLFAGELRRPIDIFDLLLHGGPVALLGGKIGLDVARRIRGSGPIDGRGDSD